MGSLSGTAGWEESGNHQKNKSPSFLQQMLVKRSMTGQCLQVSTGLGLTVKRRKVSNSQKWHKNLLLHPRLWPQTGFRCWCCYTTLLAGCWEFSGALGAPASSSGCGKLRCSPASPHASLFSQSQTEPGTGPSRHVTSALVAQQRCPWASPCSSQPWHSPCE